MATFKTLGDMLLNRYTSDFIKTMTGEDKEVYRETHWRVMAGGILSDQHSIQHIHYKADLDIPNLRFDYHTAQEYCGACGQEVPDNVLAIQKVMNL